MYDDYCFRCGAYTAIDRLTKMCQSCFDRWCGDPGRPGADAGRAD